MNDYTEGGGGLGCMLQAAAVGLALMALMALAGGDSTGNTSTNTANVETLSRNQVNLWSDVQNEFYSCNAAGSCVTSVTTDASTTSTNVDGDRNTIILSDGRTACEDPNFPGQFAPEYCEGNW